MSAPQNHRRSWPRYRTIVADPPWPIAWTGGAATRVNGRGERHVNHKFKADLPYERMSIEDICALPVAPLAEDDAHLYLWTTNRYLRDAYAVAEAWGFRFAQLLVWAKTPMGKGPGGAFAQNAEYILFCRRGTLAHVEKLDTVWFNWNRTAKHSVKPDAMLDMVERVSPGPYLEMFARRARLGDWSYWGNESLCTVQMEAPDAA